MNSDPSSEHRVEIAHILTMDVIAYSTLLITQQTRVMAELTRVVKQTARFQRAEKEGKLISIPTGDGMLLVFFDDPQAPIECAMEIAVAMKSEPEIGLRMGIHSGPVKGVMDVNDRSNVAGAGVDLAQRVMDCGDAGHILLSKHVADDLAPFPRWNPHLHDLGEREVKHGRKISLVNFYTSEVGNPVAPAKCAARSATENVSSPLPKRALGITVALLAIALGVVIFLSLRTRTSSTAADPQTNTQTIAVLPFENASSDPNAEYLSEGISEALINSLTELQQLRVIARATAFHYKGKDVDPRQVGRELKVAAVLTGKLRQMQDSLSVQVDLVDAVSGAQLWGASYDRKISDVVAVKQVIAREIAEKLKVKLSGDDRRRLVKRDTANPEAYQFYLRGRYFGNKRTPEAIKQAIEEFQQALERDPQFALGYAGLADSYVLLQQYAGVPSSEAIPLARAAADRAVQIDDSLAEAHTSSGGVHLFSWQWPQAEQEFRRAISLNDNYATAHHWYSVFLRVEGRLDEALRESKRAQELDPLSPTIPVNSAVIFLLKNDSDAAIEQCQRIIELDSNHQLGHEWLGWAYFNQRRYPEAIAELEKAAAVSGKSSPQLSNLGCVYAVAGRRDEALGILKELEERSGRREAIGEQLAGIYASLGDNDQAFAWLEKDFAERSGDLPSIRWRPQFESLRTDPRYADMIRRMGLNP